MSTTNTTIFFVLSLLLGLLLVRCKNQTKEKQIPIIQTKQSEKYTVHYPSGQLKTEGTYIDGKKTGKWISYTENGEELSVRNYTLGVLDGYQKMTFSQNLYMEGHSKNGVKIGTWKSYFKANQQLKYVKHFDALGNAIGEWKTYYDSGEIFTIDNYTNNSPNGK